MGATEAGTQPAIDGARLLERLRDCAGGEQLLELARDREDIALVGGAVRDLLLGRDPRELDVVVAGDGAALAGELAERLPATGDEEPLRTVHERFGTASVEWPGGRVDVAERRAESYPVPGALPRVRAGGVEEDLARRDFTVNAISVRLGGPLAGELAHAPHALDDLAGARLRVLHERSFLDDPTRLLRLARYQARLGFELETHTARLAIEALRAGALASVSLARVGAELRLALGEADPLAALAALERLGVLAALEPMRFDPGLAGRALELLPADGRPELLLLASLLTAGAEETDGEQREDSPRSAIFALLDGFELTASERELTIGAALAAGSLARELERAEAPSAIGRALAGRPVEAVALAGALGQDSAAPAREWIERLRHVELSITGSDLIAAGIPAGPEIGRRLQAALARKLDGELEDGRESELRAASEARA